MQNRTERTRERERFGYISIAASLCIYSCDLILTGSCQRYDRVITALTAPRASSSTRHENHDAQSSETAVCYQHNHSLNRNLKWLTTIWEFVDSSIIWGEGCHRQILCAGLFVRAVKSLWCADSQDCNPQRQPTQWRTVTADFTDFIGVKIHTKILFLCVFLYFLLLRRLPYRLFVHLSVVGRGARQREAFQTLRRWTTMILLCFYLFYFYFFAEVQGKKIWPGLSSSVVIIFISSWTHTHKHS